MARLQVYEQKENPVQLRHSAFELRWQSRYGQLRVSFGVSAGAFCWTAE